MQPLIFKYLTTISLASVLLWCAFPVDAQTWQQTAKLRPDDGSSGTEFSYSVAISGDTVAIGAPAETNDSDKGGASVFVREATDWVQQAKLPSAGGAPDFGQWVAIAGDQAVIGSGVPGKNAVVFMRDSSLDSDTASAVITVISELILDDEP